MSYIGITGPTVNVMAQLVNMSGTYAAVPDQYGGGVFIIDLTSVPLSDCPAEQAGRFLWIGSGAVIHDPDEFDDEDIQHLSDTLKRTFDDFELSKSQLRPADLRIKL